MKVTSICCTIQHHDIRLHVIPFNQIELHGVKMELHVIKWNRMRIKWNRMRIKWNYKMELHVIPRRKM